jgi:hypothetical protein
MTLIDRRFLATHTPSVVCVMPACSYGTEFPATDR